MDGAAYGKYPLKAVEAMDQIAGAVIQKGFWRTAAHSPGAPVARSTAGTTAVQYSIAAAVQQVTRCRLVLPPSAVAGRP